MEHLPSIFDLFGGIRPMARTLGESPSKVMAWKRAGHIPAQKQADVLAKGVAAGLSVTAEHVVFPLGRHVVEIADEHAFVDCAQNLKAQRKGRPQ